ncbi:MAG TPA: hypothetical protein VFF16_17225, partial [Telluria sp.]|nr:hypothetical protein [Telluria sp.]
KVDTRPIDPGMSKKTGNETNIPEMSIFGHSHAATVWRKRHLPKECSVDRDQDAQNFEPARGLDGLL